MLRLVVILLVMLVALAQGGRLQNLAGVQLRALPLVFGSIGLQILIFTPIAGMSNSPMLVAPIYLLSMVLLVVWVALNRGVPGMALIAAGVLMNTAAIAANGGYMPVEPAAAEYAGRLGRYEGEGDLVLNNSVAGDGAVNLWLLTDIFPVPAGIPLANVYSLGDILLTTGIGIFCYRVLRTTPPPQESAPRLSGEPLVSADTL